MGRSLAHSKSLSSSAQQFFKTRAYGSVLMQSLERREVDNVYKPNAICGIIAVSDNTYHGTVAETANLPNLL